MLKTHIIQPSGAYVPFLENQENDFYPQNVWKTLWKSGTFSKDGIQGKIICISSKVTKLHLYLKILTGKKHRQIKLQRLQKVQICAFDRWYIKINSL